MACSRSANAPEEIRRLFGLCRRQRLMMRRIVNPYEWRPGHQPRPRLQTIAQHTPAVVSQKKSWRSQSHLFRQHDRPNSTRTEGSNQNTEDTLKTSIAAPPSLLRGWNFRPPSGQARDAEGDTFLACAAKKKERLAAARTRRRMPSLSSALVGFCHPGVV